MILRFFFPLELILTKSRNSTAKEEKEIATQSDLKDFSYLKREFLTTTLVINLPQANQKQRKIKSPGQNRVEVRLGFRLWVTALTRRAAGNGCCTFIIAAPTWPPVAASEEATSTHFPAASLSHKVRTHNQPTYKTISEASLWKGEKSSTHDE